MWRWPAIHIEQVGRVLQLLDQLGQLDRVVDDGVGIILGGRCLALGVPPLHQAAHSGHGNRDVRGNHHQLVVGLASVQFRLQPFPARFVQEAVAVDVVGAIRFQQLGVVQHDDFERYARLGHKAVAGKSVLAAARVLWHQVETVPTGLGGGVEKFCNPFAAQQGAPVGVSGHTWGRCKVFFFARVANGAIGAGTVHHPHVKVLPTTPVSGSFRVAVQGTGQAGDPVVRVARPWAWTGPRWG